MRLAAPVMAATFAATLVRAWVPAPAQRAVFSRAARLRTVQAAPPLKAATTEKELLAEVQQLERSLSASSARKPRVAPAATVQPPATAYAATPSNSVVDAELNAADASRAYRCK